MKHPTVDGERLAHSRAVRDAVETEIRRGDFAGPDFRWTEVRVVAATLLSPSSILAVEFHRDNEPGQVDRYWTYIWEQVAWGKAVWTASVRSQPSQLGG